MPCPRCGFDHSFRTCPNCGLKSDAPAQPSDPVGPPPPPLPGGGYAAAPTGDGRTGPPWEHRDSLGVVEAAIQTIKGVLFEPAATFRSMRREGDIGGPFLFGWALATLGGLVGYAFQTALQMAGMAATIPGLPEAGTGEGGAAVAAQLGGMCGGLIGVPIGVAIALFIGSGILHLCLMIVGGARQPFETTFRVYAYTGGATALFQVIPICGGIIGGVWAIVANIIGLREAHEIDTWRAVVAVLIPIVLCCACIGVLAIFFGAAIMAALGQAAGGG